MFNCNQMEMFGFEGKTSNRSNVIGMQFRWIFQHRRRHWGQTAPWVPSVFNTSGHVQHKCTKFLVLLFPPLAHKTKSSSKLKVYLGKKLERKQIPCWMFLSKATRAPGSLDSSVAFLGFDLIVMYVMGIYVQVAARWMMAWKASWDYEAHRSCVR